MKRSEIQTFAKAAIDASAYVIEKAVPVIIDTGLPGESKVCEGHLDDEGVVVVITPILVGRVKDQGPRVITFINTICAEVRENPKVNNSQTGAGVNHSELIDAITLAMLAYGYSPQTATLGFRVDEAADAAQQLALRDDGLLTTNLFFSVQTELRRS